MKNIYIKLVYLILVFFMDFNMLMLQIKKIKNNYFDIFLILKNISLLQ